VILKPFFVYSLLSNIYHNGLIITIILKSAEKVCINMYVLNGTNKNRPLCQECNSKPAAYNYRRGDKIYYRKKCDSCIRKTNTSHITTPAWQRAGYTKGKSCEMCGFTAQHPHQLDVYYVDANMNNNSPTNLKTVCATCNRLFHAKKQGGRQGSLTADR